MAIDIAIRRLINFPVSGVFLLRLSSRCLLSFVRSLGRPLAAVLRQTLAETSIALSENGTVGKCSRQNLIRRHPKKSNHRVAGPDEVENFIFQKLEEATFIREKTSTLQVPTDDLIQLEDPEDDLIFEDFARLRLRGSGEPGGPNDTPT